MVFLSKNSLHLTEQSGFACFSRVKCKIYLQFLLSLPQTVAANKATAVCGRESAHRWLDWMPFAVYGTIN